MHFPILNLHEARFECTYGRGCDGVCCKQGRPPVYPDEANRIQTSLPDLLALMRPEAATLVTQSGFLSRRRKAGTAMLRVVNGWCVFFNSGCVLHKLGAAEGDRFRYKPLACSLFPLDKHDRRGWYVRQRGFLGEKWDLFCLDPAASPQSAAVSLSAEVALIERYEQSGADRD